ncbi:cytochrome c oxidase subunit II, partial|nr:cytochrome c oxidase subunit II [Escherichia coli]
MRTVRTINRSLWSLATFGALLFPTVQAQAGGLGQPIPWEMSRQIPVTENARDILSFEIGLHWLSLAISVFVLGLILWCVFRFGEKRNPTPSRTTHN